MITKYEYTFNDRIIISENPDLISVVNSCYNAFETVYNEVKASEKNKIDVNDRELSLNIVNTPHGEQYRVALQDERGMDISTGVALQHILHRYYTVLLSREPKSEITFGVSTIELIDYYKAFGGWEELLIRNDEPHAMLWNKILELPAINLLIARKDDIIFDLSTYPYSIFVDKELHAMSYEIVDGNHLPFTVVGSIFSSCCRMLHYTLDKDFSTTGWNTK